ncbi:MAG: FAD:protein FMN transferase [Methylococcales bacterium]|nr:FAD:protein FMN transferase [Methylococcales bacterium]
MTIKILQKMNPVPLLRIRAGGPRLFTGCGLIFSISLLLACTEPTVQKFEGAAQGTTYHISYWSKLPMDGKDIETSVKNELDAIDKTLSNYRPDSVIELFNSAENTESQVVGNEIVSLVRVAQVVHKASQGCYDLTFKPLFELWGFRKDELAIPNDQTLLKTLSQIGMDKLEVVDDTHLRKKQADLKVDLSSIAQGYSVGKISKLLEQKGISDYLVEIGGELQTRGQKPNSEAWRIALEKPLPGEQRMQKVITMPKDSPLSIMTAGTYNHYFDFQGQRYSHILDARTGRPISHDLVSVTVIHDDPTIADAWDTALLCLGQSEGMKAANTAKIPAFFIQQQGDKLIESRSDALNALTGITLN